MSTTDGCIYDYPLYYDILMGWDRDAEASFYDAALRLCGAPEGGRLLEAACGTGQIALRLATLGWQVTGLDLSRRMLDFLEEAARERGLPVRTVFADMTAFTLSEAQDAAICPGGSFAILQDDASALRHLDSMAVALRPGGVYVLEIEFAAGAGEAHSTPAEGEEWSMCRGGIEVRAEGDGISVGDRGRGIQLRLDWGVKLRRYTGPAFAALVERSGAFEIAAWHPEAGRDDEGVSFFDFDHVQHAPAAGRAMVILRRSP
ncbi:MAG: class I SAM-dependent methyltransferase [Candidatus Brocadiia bacterium]|jgi:SAM-dependent methyltransferase|nr:class I SAM-dependent methyltransferase [Candidatus Brocadiia bacterium]